MLVSTLLCLASFIQLCLSDSSTLLHGYNSTSFSVLSNIPLHEYNTIIYSIVVDIALFKFFTITQIATVNILQMSLGRVCIHICWVSV